MDENILGSEAASENDALLSPVKSRDSRDDDGKTTINESKFRLVAAMLDFLVTGVAFAAVGVCIH